jgi:serine/threonine protein kinase
MIREQSANDIAICKIMSDKLPRSPFMDSFPLADQPPTIVGSAVTCAQAIIADTNGTFCKHKLGPHEIQSLLGTGGTGELYRAMQSSLGRQVAAQVLSPEFAADSDRLRRFEQEARAACTGQITRPPEPRTHIDEVLCLA